MFIGNPDVPDNTMADSGLLKTDSSLVKTARGACPV